MHVLTIDPSTSCGWCFQRDGETSILFGTWKLGEGLSPGRYFLNLYKRMSDFRKEQAIEDDDLQIVIENNSLNAVGSAETKHLAESWVGIIEIYCEAKGLRPPVAVGVNSWRSAFIGRSMAPKEVTDKTERRKWIKAETMRACKQRNLNVTDDNQADAIGIMFWFLHDGHHVQEQRRADRKAKSKAKRAQMKLFKSAA